MNFRYLEMGEWTRVEGMRRMHEIFACSSDWNVGRLVARALGREINLPPGGRAGIHALLRWASSTSDSMVEVHSGSVC